MNWESKYTKLISLFEKEGIELMGLDEYKRTPEFLKDEGWAIHLFLYTDYRHINVVMSIRALSNIEFVCKHQTAKMKRES